MPIRSVISRVKNIGEPNRDPESGELVSDIDWPILNAMSIIKPVISDIPAMNAEI
ncbi:MAG: hypothetical protein ACXAEU_26385 [Candidatus Hodarchaeales archaeon]